MTDSSGISLAVRVLRPRSVIAELDLTVDALAAGEGAHSPAEQPGGAAGLGQTGPEVAERLVAVSVLSLHRLRAARALDQVLQALPVAVQEGLSLRLTVVGEDDQVIGALSVGGRCGDAGDLPVHAAQRREGIHPLDAGVVRHLVVGQERRVPDRPARVEVSDHGGDLEVALDHRAPRPHQRVRERPLDPRANVAASLLGGEVELLGDVADHQHDRAGDAVGFEK